MPQPHASKVWETMRITPPKERKVRWPVVRYDPGFAAWQMEHDEVHQALRRWKVTLLQRNPRLKLAVAHQGELPL